jgi:hypothetical protein
MMPFEKIFYPSLLLPTIFIFAATTGIVPSDAFDPEGVAFGSHLGRPQLVLIG